MDENDYKEHFLREFNIFEKKLKEQENSYLDIFREFKPLFLKMTEIIDRWHYKINNIYMTQEISKLIEAIIEMKPFTAFENEEELELIDTGNPPYLDSSRYYHIHKNTKTGELYDCCALYFVDDDKKELVLTPIEIKGFGKLLGNVPVTFPYYPNDIEIRVRKVIENRKEVYECLNECEKEKLKNALRK